MRVIGDIHGKVPPYLNLIAGADESIQVGDFGLGFIPKSFLSEVHAAHANGKHRFIRGNHDDPAKCRETPGYIEDGYFDAERSIMHVGGAWSIDHEHRKAADAQYGSVSWWPDEECTTAELLRIHASYVYHKPRVMITHDCPMQVSKRLFFNGKYKMYGPHQSTQTAEALQAMFMEHQPELWIFGHWHIPADEHIDSTRFICLPELAYVDINV